MIIFSPMATLFLKHLHVKYFLHKHRYLDLIQFPHSDHNDAFWVQGMCTLLCIGHLSQTTALTFYELLNFSPVWSAQCEVTMASDNLDCNVYKSSSVATVTYKCPISINNSLLRQNNRSSLFVRKATIGQK